MLFILQKAPGPGGKSHLRGALGRGAGAPSSGTPWPLLALLWSALCICQRVAKPVLPGAGTATLCAVSRPPLPFASDPRGTTFGGAPALCRPLLITRPLKRASLPPAKAGRGAGWRSAQRPRARGPRHLCPQRSWAARTSSACLHLRGAELGNGRGDQSGQEPFLRGSLKASPARRLPRVFVSHATLPPPAPAPARAPAPAPAPAPKFPQHF